jgi:hypothetical protein
LAAVTAGANRLHITSGGLVGLGTSSPAELLDCKGNIILGAQNAASGILQPTSGSGTDINGSNLILRAGRPTGSGSSGQVQICPSTSSTTSGTGVRNNKSKGLYIQDQLTSWDNNPDLGILKAVFGQSATEGNRSNLGSDGCVVTIDGANNGSQSALEIVGSRNTANGTQGFIRFFGSSSKNPYATITVTTPGADYTSGNLQIRTYNAGVEGTVATFTNTGRVGIGTTSPGVALHVDGDIRCDGVYAETDTNTSIQFPGSDVITFNEGGSEAARIDSSGRLLVGTSTTNLDGAFVATDSGADVAFGFRNNATATNTSCSIHLQAWTADSSQAGNAIIRATKDSTTFGTNLSFFTTIGGTGITTEAFRVNENQEVLIGYTSDNGAYKLQVNSQIFATSATVATSDGRYKENVAALDGCLDLVKALRPVSFTWKQQQDITRTDDDGNEMLVREGHNFPVGTQVGFIAQEVQEALTDKPWLNSVIKENVRPAVLDDEGNELAPEEQFFGIAEGNLIAVLTNALQEAVAQIETLKDRVTALEAQ